MRPHNQQIVRSALSTIVRAQRHPTYVNMSTVLDGLHVALNELLLRRDEDYYADVVREGRRLADEAGALLGETPPAEKPEPVLDQIDTIIALNADRVRTLSRLGTDAAADLVRRIVDWELAFYARHTESAMSEDDQEQGLERLTAENLATYLRAKRPDWPNLRVTSFNLQPGGYSKITVLVGLEDDANGAHGVVIRAEPARRMLDLDGMAIASEYPLIRYAFEAGLPVAEPILLETDTSHLGVQFMLSRRMPGKVTGTFTGSDAEIGEDLVKMVLDLIARIANTPVDRDSPLIQASHLGRWLAHDTLPGNTREFIEYWRDVGVRGNSVPSALLNYAVNWLLTNIPEEDVRPNLIHGDVGFHNILFEDGRISALLDWENARFGDTAEELSMFVSSIAHLFPHDRILQWYHEAGGPPVSEWRLRYFDVYMAMKIIVSAQVSLQRVEETPENNLHLAVFGLRFLHMIGSRLNGLIELAEAARDAERAAG